MTKTKNRRKLLRAQCPECGTVQDALRIKCKQCGAMLHADLTPGETDEVRRDVTELEELLDFIEAPSLSTGKNPYRPLDRSFALMRQLWPVADRMPGMRSYLEEVKLKLLPFRIRMLKSTFRANLIFLIILVAFPVLPLALDWAMTAFYLMLMPAGVWLLVTFKAWLDLNKAQKALRTSS